MESNHNTSGIRVLVTAGPTLEMLDPVRYLSNFSSGKQGYAVAECFAALGCEVTLVSGPVVLAPPAGVHFFAVQSARQMLQACVKCLPVDIFVACAAVCDWQLSSPAPTKLKKHPLQKELPLQFIKTPDILHYVSTVENRPAIVVGFAAETENVIDNAQKKLREKHCDWIVANSVHVGSKTFGGDTNIVSLVTKTDVEMWPQMPKKKVAQQLTQKILEKYFQLSSS